MRCWKQRKLWPNHLTFVTLNKLNEIIYESVPVLVLAYSWAQKIFVFLLTLWLFLKLMLFFYLRNHSNKEKKVFGKRESSWCFWNLHVVGLLLFLENKKKRKLILIRQHCLVLWINRLWECWILWFYTSLTFLDILKNTEYYSYPIFFPGKKKAIAA